MAASFYYRRLVPYAKGTIAALSREFSLNLRITISGTALSIAHWTKYERD
jgi:hypothetical protein